MKLGWCRLCKWKMVFGLRDLMCIVEEKFLDCRMMCFVEGV